MRKYDKFMIETAQALSSLSTCKRGQVGAIVSKGGRILVTGYNGTISGQDNNCEYKYVECGRCKKHLEIADEVLAVVTDITIVCSDCRADNDYKNVNKHIKLKTNDLTLHAEQNAIAYAAKLGIPLDDTTMYVSMSPCKQCAKLIAQSGVTRVVYANEYRDTTGIEFLKFVGVEVNKYESKEK